MFDCSSAFRSARRRWQALQNPVVGFSTKFRDQSRDQEAQKEAQKEVLSSGQELTRTSPSNPHSLLGQSEHFEF